MNDGFRWNQWNVDHIEQHAVSSDEAEYVIDWAKPPYPEPIGDNKWRVRGQSLNGRYLQVIFVFDPDNIIYVIHARGLNEQEKRQLRRRMK